jgi:hypothetical protein
MLVGDQTTCTPSEQQMDWVVGGEVTDITLGRGLVGSREDGEVLLELDPDIIQGCGSCVGGRIVAGFDDGPGTIPADGFNPPTQIAALDLPAGNYAIFAKMTLVQPTDDAADVAGNVSCRLTAEADFDDAQLSLEDLGSFLGNIQGLTLQVVHHFAAPGEVALACKDTTNVEDKVHYQDLKIIAIEAASLSNVFLGGS